MTTSVSQRLHIRKIFRIIAFLIITMFARLCVMFYFYVEHNYMTASFQ